MNERVIVIDSDSAQLKGVREELQKLLSTAGFRGKALDDLLVALGEATSNSIRHAYANEKGHEVRITLEDQPDKIVLRIRDFGKKINLSQVKPPELPPTKPSGLGIYFMKTMVDDLQYNTAHAQGNEVILTKFKPTTKE